MSPRRAPRTPAPALPTTRTPRRVRRATTLAELDAPDPTSARPDPGRTSRLRSPSRPSAPRAAMPVSSFDFLEGRFRSAIRTRSTNFILGAVLLAVAAGLVLSGLAASLTARTRQDEILSARSNLASLGRQLDERSASGAVIDTDADAHVDSRASLAATAAQNQTAYAKIIGDIFALSDPVTVESVAFSAPTVPGTVATIVVTGSAPTAQDVAVVAATLGDAQRFGYLTVIDESSQIQCTAATVPGRATGCRWTWKGSVTDDVRGLRAAEIVAAFEVQPVTGPAPLPDAAASGSSS